MKTMKLNKEIPIRIKDEKVDEYLKKGYKYCPKSEWKIATRKTEEQTEKKK